MINALINKSYTYYYYSDDFKSYVALKNVDSSKVTEKECSSVYSNDVLDANGEYYTSQYGVCKNGESTKVISYVDANQKYKEMYGNEMPKEGFSMTSLAGQFYSFYDYIESLDSFVEVKCNACGGACTIPGDAKEIKVNSANYINNNLVISVNYSTDEYEVVFEENNNGFIFKSLSKK